MLFFPQQMTKVTVSFPGKMAGVEADYEEWQTLCGMVALSLLLPACVIVIPFILSRVSVFSILSTNRFYS